jgi:hypothetical protein
MKRIVLGAPTIIGAVFCGTVVFAQAPAPQPAAPPTQTPTARSSAAESPQRVTVVGCVQREADYRKAKDAGKGGVAGTGVGVDNEFVLAAATMSASAAPGTPTGTAGTSASPADYELTGSNESQAGSFAGKRVEIIGMLKPAEVAASGAPTGGPTAGAPPKGVDVTSKDLQLRELEVSSVREMTGSCPS